MHVDRRFTHGDTCSRMQEPILGLLHRHMDAKGKQAKLKSPQELQDLLDVTRELLHGMEKHGPSKLKPSGGPLERTQSGEKYPPAAVAAAGAARKEGAGAGDTSKSSERGFARSLTHVGACLDRSSSLSDGFADGKLIHRHQGCRARAA